MTTSADSLHAKFAGLTKTFTEWTAKVGDVLKRLERLEQAIFGDAPPEAPEDTPPPQKDPQS